MGVDRGRKRVMKHGSRWCGRNWRTLLPIVLETHGKKWTMSVMEKVSFGPKGPVHWGWGRGTWNDMGKSEIGGTWLSVSGA